MQLLRISRALLILALALAALAAGILLNILLYPSASLRVRATAFGAMIWAKFMLMIMDIRLTSHGEIPLDKGSFTICNHISYIDILVLGSVRPSVFVARRDLKSWPLVGWLAALSGSVFLDRRSGHAAMEAMKIIDARIDEGLNVILFPEGTTSDGKSIGSFKSALFDLPARRNLAILPMSIRYTGLDSAAQGQSPSEQVAWYGDMTLLPHLWKILGTNSISVSVSAGRPLRPVRLETAAETRKRLCLFARESVIERFEAFTS
jgi:1-acyl-sn-glycerol-3-phosphate acyltransferase